MIILDSDVLIEVADGRSVRGKAALERLEASGEDIAVTAIGIHEVLYGLLKRGKKAAELQTLSTFEFGPEDAAESAAIEVSLERAGKKCGRLDSMVAGIAIRRKASLFAFNTKHFQPMVAFGLRLF